MTKKDNGGKQPVSQDEPENALAARRARLRSSLAKQKLPTDPYSSQISSELSQEIIASDEDELPSMSSEHSAVLSSAAGASSGRGIINRQQDSQDNQEIVLLNHIDQALGSCAVHLASLQKVADNQIDELKVIAATLQTKPVADIGRSLDTLMESLTAAIEPMKVMGELVPVLDRLVNVTEAKDHSFDAVIEPIKAIGTLIPLLERLVNRAEINEASIEKSLISSEQLTISLAQQLAAGSIDPRTFKSAYKAIFPDNDDALLVHRLGELLAGQHLSAEAFQASYNALQSSSTQTQPPIDEAQGSMWAPNIANVNALSEQEWAVREGELQRLLAVKEEELENIRGQVDSQWKELAAECEELRSALQERQKLLQEKELDLNKKLAELVAKDSENQQLRVQMEQLRDETKAMMTDLQKQLFKKQQDETVSSTKKSFGQDTAIAAPQANQADISADGRLDSPTDNSPNPPTPQTVPQTGFFDFVGANSQPTDLFSAMSKNTDLFSPDEEVAESQADTSNMPIVSPSTVSAWGEPAQTRTGEGLNTVERAVPQRPAFQNAAKEAPLGATAAPASFVSAVGSYGSGVRAQVFEVIVRQALAGTQWREICAVPMQSNNIAPDEVEAEVKRRQALLKK